MIYNEVATGGAELGGCSVVVYTDVVVTQYGPGDILYSLAKAKKGVLEKVVIRKQHIVNPIFVHGGLVVYYEDSFHSLWNESDLTTHQNAVDLATAYYELLIAQSEAIKTC